MKIKKRSSQPKKDRCSKRVNVILKISEWIIYIGFCILACLFIRDVWSQYHAKETFMGQSLKPITKLPTILICLDTLEILIYSKGDLIIEQRDPNDNYQAYKENETLHFQEWDEYVHFEQTSVNCFKINATTGNIKVKDRFIKINITKKIKPPIINAYFTSEENSYGFFNNEWYDGKVFQQKIYPSHTAIVYLEPREYTYLDFDRTRCSSKTFLEQWMPKLQMANFSHCSKICSRHTTFVTDQMPFCGYTMSFDLICPTLAIIQSYNKLKENKDGDYKRPCNVLEYSGLTTHHGKLPTTSTASYLKYQFSPPQMTVYYQERLVFDVIGMVGSVGGTLGMCIGFSFSGISSTIHDSIKSRLNSLI